METIDEAAAAALVPGTREYAAEDLRRLVNVTDDGNDVQDEDDLPPLLQVRADIFHMMCQKNNNLTTGMFT